MPASQDIDSLNKEFYLKNTAAAWYATKAFILPEEQSFLNAFAGELRGRSLLDIGIGAGRSTRFLLPLNPDYIGVDYSPDMVAEAARHFPHIRLEVRDARDLSAYIDGQFDAVLFSFNGLDCLSHEGRLQALTEIRRVLKPGGLFGFSSHNRTRPKVNPWSPACLNRSRHPVRLLRNVVEYLAGIRNWWRSRHCAFEAVDHALRHDSGNHFNAPMYYIDKPNQVRQLTKAGFDMASIFDAKGNSDTAESSDPASPWIFYACRKRA
jgi:SAM-dependent methyltransferase